MMRKLLYIVGLASIIFTSCLNEKTEGGGGNKGNVKKGFKLNYSVPGSKINTYATVPSEVGEDQINSLYILFFERSSGGTGKFIEFFEIEIDDPLSSSGMINIEFDQNSNLNKSTAYSMLLVANLDSYLDVSVEEWVSTLPGLTQSDVVQGTFSYVTGAVNDNQNDNQQSIGSHNLLMSAQVQKDADQEYVSVDLVRALARFDVINDASGFELVSASIWNAFPQTSVWESAFNDWEKVRIKRYYGVQTDNNEIKGGLYAFENFVTSPQQNDEKTTCLILGVRPEGINTKTTYYRVNISPRTAGQYLKRNNVYQVTIRDVLKEGADNEKDAYTNNEFNLETQINKWDLDEYGNIIVDGDNLLALPTTKISFTPLAETREYLVYTVGEGILEISKIDLPQGITATLSGKNLTVRAEASNEYREGSFELRFANLKGTIYVTQTGEFDNFLTLSETKVPTFPSATAMEMVGSIKVESSGLWDAKIYNNGPSPGVFTFQPGGSLEVLEDMPSGESIRLATTGRNDNEAPYTAFILVTLQDDPENFQRVLVITQSGKGGFTISPAQTNIRFDAEGDLISGSTNQNEFTVTPGGNDSWEAVLMGPDADKFKIEHSSGLSHVTGIGSFKVTAKAPNATASELKATVRVRFTADQNNYKEMDVTQQKHTISLSITNPTAISYLGGQTAEIIVTTSAPTSTYRWQAEMTHSHPEQQAYFNGTPTVMGTTTLDDMMFSEKFRVTYPALVIPSIVPTAIVTVRLKGTDVTASMTVTQQSFQYNTNIVFMTARPNSYSSLNSPSDAEYKRINRLGDNLRNANYFSLTNANATVKIPTVATWVGGNDVSSNPDIFWANAEIQRGGKESDSKYTSTPSQFNSWRLGSDKRILMIEGSWYGNQVLVSTGVAPAISSPSVPGIGFDYSDLRDAGPIAVDRTVNSNSTVRATALWKYLFEEGPFGPVNPNNVKLRSSDGTYGHISKWPSTMIPILAIDHATYGNNRCVFGIDPVNRVIWIGDGELFSSKLVSTNYPGTGGDNERFLNNVIAYMLNVVHFGDAFNEQFKENGPFSF